jgi:hypothetical protein
MGGGSAFAAQAKLAWAEVPITVDMDGRVAADGSSVGVQVIPQSSGAAFKLSSTPTFK